MVVNLIGLDTKTNTEVVKTVKHQLGIKGNKNKIN